MGDFIPTINTIINGVNVSNRYTTLYNNQFFDYLGEQLPKEITELFKWCEHVYFNSPHLVNAIRKLINYPITDFEFKTDSKKIRQATQDLLDSLNIKSHLLDTGLNYYIYGNAFRSIHTPFKRFLKCNSCEQEVSIEEATYIVKKFEFIMDCPICKTKRKAEISDKEYLAPEDVKIINWNINNIKIFVNPITGKTRYYYVIPSEVKQGYVRKEPGILNDTPKIFLDAVKNNKNVQFNNNFYHLKAQSIDGFISGWGIPPLASVLKLYFYSAVLKKANEAIALERITPKLVLFPNVNTSDPTMLATLGDWKSNINDALRAWKKDPNYVMLAPYPTGMVNLGSDAKMLLMGNELKMIEEDMIRALDIPVEFIYGSTNIQNTSVALRMLENQLTPYVDQTTDYVNWLIKTISAYTGKEYCEVKFTPFKLIDDIMQKQVLLNLAGQAVSKNTLQEMFGLDPLAEREKLKADAIEDYKMQKEIQEAEQKEQQDIALQAQQEAQAQTDGSIPQYNQQKLIAQADQIAYQFLQIPYEERRSYLAQLQNEDFVMYSLVKARMENLKEQADTAQKAANRTQQQQTTTTI